MLQLRISSRITFVRVLAKMLLVLVPVMLALLFATTFADGSIFIRNQSFTYHLSKEKSYDSFSKLKSILTETAQLTETEVTIVTDNLLYELGSYVGHVGLLNKSNYYCNTEHVFKDSIGCLYIRKYPVPPEQLRLHSSQLQNCSTSLTSSFSSYSSNEKLKKCHHTPDLWYLSSLVNDFITKSKTAKRPPLAIPDVNTTVVHLRLGDTISKSCYSSYCNKLVFSKFDYVSLLQDANKTIPRGNKIVIVGFPYHLPGGHVSLNDVLHKLTDLGLSKYLETITRSIKYRAEIALFFQNHFKNVEIRGLHSPDEDFAYMSSAKHLIAGGGGYGDLIYNLVKLKGGTAFQVTRIQQRNYEKFQANHAPLVNTLDSFPKFQTLMSSIGYSDKKTIDLIERHAMYNLANIVGHDTHRSPSFNGFCELSINNGSIGCLYAKYYPIKATMATSYVPDIKYLNDLFKFYIEKTSAGNKLFATEIQNLKLGKTTIVHLHLGADIETDNCHEVSCKSKFVFTKADYLALLQSSTTIPKNNKIVIVGFPFQIPEDIQTKHGRNEFHKFTDTDIAKILAVIIRSIKYRAEIALFFQNHFKNVEIRGLHSPDEDFAYMSSAKHLISNSGRFSELVNKMVTYNNGTIYKPIKTAPPITSKNASKNAIQDTSNCGLYELCTVEGQICHKVRSNTYRGDYICTAQEETLRWIWYKDKVGHMIIHPDHDDVYFEGDDSTEDDDKLFSKIKFNDNIGKKKVKEDETI